MVCGQEHDVGDLVVLQGEYIDPDTGDPVDPTTVTIEVKTPDDAIDTKVYITDPEVVKVSTGVYTRDWSVTQEGHHWYRWSSTGIGQAAEEQSFLVKKQQVV